VSILGVEDGKVEGTREGKSLGNVLEADDGTGVGTTLSNRSEGTDDGGIDGTREGTDEGDIKGDAESPSQVKGHSSSPVTSSAIEN
jgi:hypothetical protein